MTFRIITEDNPGHSENLSLDEAVEFAFQFCGADRDRIRNKLTQYGRAVVLDDAGEVRIEREEPY